MIIINNNNQQVESIKTLVGPVYGDGKSNYNEIQHMAEGFKNLNGPVYVKKGEKYRFNELLPVPDSLKPISGPVYMHGDTTHHFSEVAKKVDGLKDLSGEYPILPNHNNVNSINMKRVVIGYLLHTTSQLCKITDFRSRLPG